MALLCGRDSPEESQWRKDMVTQIPSLVRPGFTSLGALLASRLGGEPATALWDDLAEDPDFMVRSSGSMLEYLASSLGERLSTSSVTEAAMAYARALLADGMAGLRATADKLAASPEHFCIVRCTQ